MGYHIQHSRIQVSKSQQNVNLEGVSDKMSVLTTNPILPHQTKVQRHQLQTLRCFQVVAVVVGVMMEDQRTFSIFLPNQRHGRRHGAPGGGGGGGGPGDSDSEDSDDKFARKLKKFLRSSRESEGGDDKSKVKEADTVKVPAFPTLESYRNWRIKTREAVVAASTKP